MMKLPEKWLFVCVVAALVLWLLCLPLIAAPPVQEGRITPADPVAAGRELVARLLSQRPAASETNQAVIRVRGKGRNKFEVPVCIETQAGKTNWSTTYRTQGTNKDHAAAFTVKHTENGPNEYRVMVFSRAPGATNEFEILKGQQAFICWFRFLVGGPGDGVFALAHSALAEERDAGVPVVRQARECPAPRPD